ncbi:MAG: hypothetical protein HND58_03985 [Planctomycetota bacterium]|nr:MAG: hypothetical protein HND58_03985 [Planctomycetota bacterium]
MSDQTPDPVDLTPAVESDTTSDSGTPPRGHAPDEGTPGSFGPRRPYREVTLSALVLALLIGIVMNASITYAGLKIGFTIGGSAIAAVVGFGILRGLMRLFVKDAGSVVEVNIAQTVGSAINTSNSGVIFTVPVLFLLGMTLDWGDLDFWLITLACVAGALLGCAFIIPLRKQMIEIDRLRFPSAVGVASILKSPGGGVKKTLVLLAGILLSALMYAPTAMNTLPAGGVADTAIVGDTQRSVAELAGVDADDRDRLDQLVFAERLSEAQAQNTRNMQGWIEAKEAPAGVARRGELIAERRAVTADLAEAKDSLYDDPIPEGTRDRIAEDKARIAEINTELESAELAPFARYSEELAIAVHSIETGFTGEGENAKALSWDDLRHRDYGWATDNLWGYHDLQLRLPEYGDPESADPGVLHPNVDRDGNGRPDLLVTDGTVDVGRAIGLPPQVQLIFAIAPFALGAGFITGRAGLMVLAGGILAYFVINPVVFGMGWLPATVEAKDAPGFAFGAFNRPLGIGLLLGGALMGVLFSVPAIAAALKSIATAGRTAGKGGREEMGIVPIVFAVIAAGLLLFMAADYVGNEPLNKNGLDPVSGLEVAGNIENATYKGYSIAFAEQDSRDAWVNGTSFGEGESAVTWDDAAKDAFLATKSAKPGLLASMNPHLRAAIIAVVGVLWIWFAGIIIAQCTGMTDWSPISGMALLTVVLVLLLSGSGSVLGAVLIGAALCVAITLAADMMADLKTGHLIGGKPRRQQMCEMFAVPIGPVITMLTILIIVGANLKTTGIAMGPGTTTSAPQAQALQAVIEGVQGGQMPYALYGLGAGLGILLGLGSFAGLGVLVGLSVYLPFMYISTYGIGCVVNIILRAFKGPRWTEEWGVPFAAGLIVGESILALIFNIVILAIG